MTIVRPNTTKEKVRRKPDRVEARCLNTQIFITSSNSIAVKMTITLTIRQERKVTDYQILSDLWYDLTART